MNKFISSLTILLLLSYSSCNPTIDGAQNEKQTTYQKIIEEGKIRVGYIAYPPSYIINSDGTQAGIFHDVMEEISKNLGLEIEYTKEVTWDGMIQDLKDEKIDVVVTGIWPTSQRGKQADFLDPLFYSVVKAYTYAGNDEFDNNLDLLNSENVKISTIDGEMTQIIATTDFPKAKQVPVTQLTGVSQTLLEIQSRKADVAFVEPVIALEFLEKNPNSIKEINGVNVLRVFPNRMMVAKNQEDLKSTLNIAIQELINNGFVERVISKYEKFPNSFYRVQLPYKQ